MRAKYATRRIDAGKYRTVCTIEQPVETVADMHSIEITWETYATRNVALDSAFGNELTLGMTTIPQKRGTVRMRSDSITRGITPRMRLRICDRVLNIEAVDDDGGERREVMIRYLEESPV